MVYFVNHLWKIGGCLLGCTLSITWGGMTVICQLHEAGCRLSVSYMREDDDCLLVTWGRMMVIRQLHEAGYLSVTWAKMTVICHLQEAGWRISFSDKRQDIGYLSATWGRMPDIWQLHEAGYRLPVSYMRQDGECVEGVFVYSVAWSVRVVVCQLLEVGCCLQGVCVCYLRDVSGCLLWYTPSITCGKLAVVCLGCTLSITWGGMTVICQLHEAGWQLSLSYMRQDSGCLQGVCNLSVTWGRIAVICQLHEMR